METAKSQINVSSEMGQAKKKLNETAWMVSKSSRRNTKKQNVGLSDADKRIYGDRMPAGYKKIRLLGWGGAAVVWLAQHIETGQKVAVKQFSKKTDTSSVQLELEIA